MAFVHSRGMARFGEAYLLANRDEDAARVAGQALAVSRERKERGHEAWMLRLHAEITAHAEPPDVEQAEAHYRPALALAEELGMRPLVAHCHLGLGRLYGKAGQFQQARAELAAAREMYRAMDMTFWLRRADAELESSSR
jgi:hypothetical protein